MIWFFESSANDDWTRMTMWISVGLNFTLLVAVSIPYSCYLYSPVIKNREPILTLCSASTFLLSNCLHNVLRYYYDEISSNVIVLLTTGTTLFLNVSVILLVIRMWRFHNRWVNQNQVSHFDDRKPNPVKKTLTIEIKERCSKEEKREIRNATPNEPQNGSRDTKNGSPNTKNGSPDSKDDFPHTKENIPDTKEQKEGPEDDPYAKQKEQLQLKEQDLDDAKPKSKSMNLTPRVPSVPHQSFLSLRHLPTPSSYTPSYDVLTTDTMIPNATTPVSGFSRSVPLSKSFAFKDAEQQQKQMENETKKELPDASALGSTTFSPISRKVQFLLMIYTTMYPVFRIIYPASTVDDPYVLFLLLPLVLTCFPFLFCSNPDADTFAIFTEMKFLSLHVIVATTVYTTLTFVESLCYSAFTNSISFLMGFGVIGIALAFPLYVQRKTFVHSQTFLLQQPPSEPFLQPPVLEYLREPDVDPTSQEHAAQARNLEKCLNNPTMMRLFMQHLKAEFSSENLMFLEAIQDLEKMNDQEKINQKAKSIYDSYVRDTAIFQINLPAEIKTTLDDIFENMVDTEQSLPDLDLKHAFNLAKYNIIHLLASDSWNRFIASWKGKKILPRLPHTPSSYQPPALII